MLQKGTGPTSTTEGIPLVKADGKVEVTGTKTGEAKEETQDPVSARLAQIYKRLEQIDAYSAEARAAAILAVSIVHVDALVFLALEIKGDAIF